MKKRTINKSLDASSWKGIFTIFITLMSFGYQSAIAQCPASSTLYGTGFAPAVGSNVNITTCAYPNERSTINGVTAGQTYVISYSANASAEVTIYDASQTSVAFGPSPVTFIASAGGTYYSQGNTAGCGSSSGCNTVNWSNTTPVSCPAPTSPGVNSLTLTSATLSWTEAGSATNWEIETGTSGFSQGTGSVTVVTSNPFTLTGLTAATSYDYYVRSTCSASDASFWTGPFTFYTGHCIPNPSSVDGLGITNVSMGTINNTTGSETGNYGDYSSMIANFTWSADMMFDIDVTLQAGYTYNMWAWVDWNDDLDFLDVGEAYYLGEASSANPTTLFSSIQVPLSVTAGAHRIRLGGADGGLGTVSPSNPCYTGSYGSFEDYTINVGTPPSCMSTDLLTVSNLTSTSADLGWLELGSATNWKVEYGASGFTLGTGDTVISSTNPLSLGSLSPLTNYEFYVRAVCAAGDSSFWNGPLAFTTVCTGPLSGIYTVDGSSAGSATNFISMDRFIQALGICGVSGPVTVNVTASSDTIVGPWDFTVITGASATNTVTINGNNNLVHKNPSANHFVRLEGTKHLTIDGFDFENQTPTVNMFGFQMKDGCDSVAISNNTIDIGMGYTSSASGGIVASSSITSATTGGDNANNVLISNNDIIGGYYGIRINGASSSNRTVGFNIMNNNIHDFYYYGIYFNNADSTQIGSNDLSRDVRANGGGFYGIYYNNSIFGIINNNVIHDLGAATSSVYGIRLSNSANVTGSSSEVINNVLYNISGSSSAYGIYLSGTKSNIYVYHNTVDIETQGGSSKYGIYNTGTPTDVSIMNNLVSMHGVGTGSSYGLYYSTNSATLLTDYNNVSVNSSGNNYYGRWGTNEITLAGFQTASSQAVNSMEADPVYTDLANGNYSPLSMTIDNMGSALGVTTDVSGATRSATTPDVGALEFTGIPGDLALTDIMLVQIDQCYGSTDSAFARVTNLLSTSSDFTTNPLTIVWNVTGPINTTDSLVVSTGSLAGSSDFVFSISTIDMSVSGDYWVSAYIKPNAVNPIASNDSIMNGHMETVTPLIEVSPDSVTMTSPFDMTTLATTSPLYPAGSFFITERCQWAGSTTGLPAGGRPAWMTSDDYIEITGVPNSSLEGFSYEMWVGTSQRVNFTFGAGTVLSPTGTAIIGTYQGSSSPANYFYVTSSYSTGSSQASGHILKDASGTIIDVLGYNTQSFSAATGVTAADWTGTTVSGGGSWGIRLTGADMNDNTGWVKAQQDPNFVNTGVTVPSPPAVAGIVWDSAGTTVGTTPNIDAGPFTTSGVYPYYVSFTNVCGTYSDTSIVTVDLTNATMTASTNVSCNAGDNGTATVTAGGGDSPYTYMWSNGDTTNMADSLMAGTHTVTVYDANLWPATATVTITEPVALMATTSTTSSTCGVPSGSATANVTGGINPYSYLWSDGQTTPVASALVGGGYTVTITDANSCMLVAMATVSDIGAPSITINVDSIVSCFGGSNGVFTASATGGSIPYAFVWSSGGVTATESGLAMGTYDVTLTDASGCVATKTGSMTQNSPVLAIVNGSTNAACYNDSTGTASSIAGGGIAPYVYSWSNGDMSANASALPAGSHMLTVMDALGCMQTTSVIISQPNQLSGAFVNAMDVSCNGGNDGSVGMLNSGGIAPYSLSWNNGSTGNNISGLSAGFVAVTITDANNCMMMDSVSIAEPSALTSTASVVSDVLCNGGNTGVASISAAGGTLPFVYAWSNGAGGSSASSLTAGSYSVTVSDGNNCQSTSSVSVTEPTMLMSTVSGTDISCFGSTDGTVSSMTSGGTSPYSQVWSNGSTLASQSSVMMGSYSVVISDANGCTTMGTASVAEPVAVVVDLGGNGILCDGESMVLDAGTGFSTYSWTSGNANQMDTLMASVLGAGISQVGVMVTDGNGCMGSDSVEITVSNPVTTTITGNPELCAYENGVLDAGPGFASYQWDNTSSSQSINVSASSFSAGTQVFSVIVADVNGCEGTASHSMEIHPEVIVALPADTVIWKDSTVTIMADSGYGSYFWNTGAFTQSIEVSSAGTYQVTVTDPSTGCEGSDQMVVDFVLGIPNAMNAQLKLYPNPAVDFINLEFNNFTTQGTVQVEILSITGQLVRTIPVDVSGVSGTQQMDVSNLAVGTYMVTFQYEGQRIVKKFTIK
ncbi:MAG: hypothetical protein ACI85Q_000715 [Salibacteraceae bacterium]|jgi:hypothetical protein